MAMVSDGCLQLIDGSNASQHQIHMRLSKCMSLLHNYIYMLHNLQLHATVDATASLQFHALYKHII